MYRTLVIICKNKPRTGHWREAEVSCRQRSIHYSAYYTATCQTQKITSHGVSFYNKFVTSIRSVDQQKNSSPKTLTSLSNQVRWGWYVTRLLAEWYERRQTIIDYRKSGRPMQVNVAFHSIEKSCVINLMLHLMPWYYIIYIYIIWYDTWSHDMFV